MNQLVKDLKRPEDSKLVVSTGLIVKITRRPSRLFYLTRPPSDRSQRDSISYLVKVIRPSTLGLTGELALR